MGRHIVETLISLISDSMLVLSTSGTIRAANAAALKLLGYSEEELLRQPVTVIFSSDVDPDLHGRQIGALLKHGRGEEFSTTCRTKSGTKLQVTLSIAVIYSALGMEKGVACLIREQREERSLVADLRLSGDFFKTVINSLPDAVMILDPHDFTIMAANSVFLQEMGLDERAVLGRPCYAVSHGSSNLGTPPGGGCPMLETLSVEKFSAAEQVFFEGGKVSRIVEISTTPIFDGKGELTYILHLSRDITARRLYEDDIREMARRLEHFNAELQQANDDLKSFASIVSHDMRSPLLSIRGFAGEVRRAVQELEGLVSGLLAGTGSTERDRAEELFHGEIDEALDFIGSSVNRLDSMIAAVLQLSRVGYRSFIPEPVDTALLLQTILNSLGHQLEQKQVSVTTASLPAVIVDRVAMEQIFGNLIDNALKYLEPGRPGELAVTADQSPDLVTFHVQDNGRGIAAKDIDKVFQLFRRVGRQDVAGEGMGLAYVKTLVRRLGGAIWCESIEGVGTTFNFTLPLQPLREEEAQPVSRAEVADAG